MKIKLVVLLLGITATTTQGVKIAEIVDQEQQPEVLTQADADCEGFMDTLKSVGGSMLKGAAGALTGAGAHPKTPPGQCCKPCPNIPAYPNVPRPPPPPAPPQPLKYYAPAPYDYPAQLSPTMGY